MARSLIYRSHWLYEGAMAALYRQNYRSRQTEIAALVPLTATVLDVCCGTATLYSRHLKGRCASYFGIDINEDFIERLRKLGADGLTADVATLAEFPVHDYCIMQASLYQFLPGADAVVDRLLRAARQSLIIAEPVRNLADSPNRILSWIGRSMTNPGSGECERRFNSQTLAAFFEKYRSLIVHTGRIAGGREEFYVLKGQAAS